MSEITLETVQSTANEALQAFEGVKSELDNWKKGAEKLDALDLEKLDKMTADITKGLEVSQKMEAQQAAQEKTIQELKAVMSRPKTVPDEQAKEIEAKQSEAFNEFLKKGAGSDRSDFADFIERKGDLPEEVKTLAVNSQADGGYLVMPVFGGIVNARVFETSPLRQLANTVSINSDAYELVLDNDEAGAGWVAEEGTRSSTDTPQFDKRSIPTHEIYAKPLATQKLLDDGVVDFEGWLAGKVSDKFGRTEATAFVSGNGVGKPMGITANTTTGTSYDARNVQIIASATQGVIGYDDLVDTQNSLKEPYQANANWLMKRATFGTILKIKSGITDDNTPIFNMQYNQNAGLEMTILTRPMRFADDMPAVGNDANAVAYGDFRSGYLIVDRIGIRTLRDPYSNKPYVEFYVTKRVGGDVVNAEAIKLLGLTG